MPAFKKTREEILAEHPDPEIAMAVYVEELEGKLADASAGLLRALDFRTASPEGLAIKRDVRTALMNSGWQGVFGECQP